MNTAFRGLPMNVNSPIQDTKNTWYLDDLSVGLQFRSGRFLIDEQQMIDFARQFDPSHFTSMPSSPNKASSAAWSRADGSRRACRCGCCLKHCRWPLARSDLAARPCSGQIQLRLATNFTLKAKLSILGPRATIMTEVSLPSGLPPTIRTTRVFSQM